MNTSQPQSERENEEVEMKEAPSVVLEFGGFVKKNDGERSTAHEPVVIDNFDDVDFVEHGHAWINGKEVSDISGATFATSRTCSSYFGKSKPRSNYVIDSKGAL